MILLVGEQLVILLVGEQFVILPVMSEVAYSSPRRTGRILISPGSS